MKPIRLLFLALLLPALAMAQEPAPATPARAESAANGQGLSPRILYQFLLAEIALGRGQVALAAAAYVDLAKNTRDARIARRAAEVAYYARQPQLSLDAARIWAETEPDSVQARQAYWSLLANLGKADQLAAALAEVVAAEKEQRGLALMQIGRMLSRLEDKKLAARVADKLTEPYPGLPEAHFIRAQAAWSSEDSARARAELDQALALKPDWEPAAILKAQLLVSNPQEAIDSLAAFIARYPDARDARFAYARALIEGKRYEDARAEFATLLRDEPERPDLLYSMGLLSLQAGEVAKAEQYLRSLLDKEFSDQDGVHFYLGQIAEDAGKAQEAIDHYDAMAPGGQHHLQGQLRAASILARSDRLQQALDRLHAAQAASPNARIELVVTEAHFLSGAGRNADALQLLGDALKEHPDDATLLYESALFAERLGRHDMAERHLRRVIQIKPDFAHAYNALGYSLADRNLNLDEAGALIDRALSLQPGDAAILDSKGWVLYRRGDLAGALEMLQQALAGRHDPEIAAHLGEVLWQLNRQEEAIKVWSEAQALSPNNEVLNATVKRLRR